MPAKKSIATTKDIQNIFSMAMYDNPNIVETSFDLNYISEHLLQAQWAEFVELKKVITNVSNQQNRPISILDIGIGNARIPKHLCGVKEIWDRIVRYDGTDNAAACIKISTETIHRLKIEDKVGVHLFEATNLKNWQQQHDLIIITWFTAGNFYPDNFKFDAYENNKQILNLSTNEKFTHIFKSACDLLLPGGEIVLGACYLDTPATRLKQEESYKKMGMTVITKPEDSFTATREGFWSQRFTQQKLETYLSFTAKENIIITPLDTYDYAIQVRIKK